VVNWPSEALSAEPSEARFNQQTTHVEALTKGQQDAGSIPAASTKSHFANRRKVAFFMGLRQLRGLENWSERSALAARRLHSKPLAFLDASGYFYGTFEEFTATESGWKSGRFAKMSHNQPEKCPIMEPDLSHSEHGDSLMGQGIQPAFCGSPKDG